MKEVRVESIDPNVAFGCIWTMTVDAGIEKDRPDRFAKRRQVWFDRIDFGN